MIKKLASHLGEYKRAAILTPMFSALEAVMDILLPTIMAFIIDLGIEKGDMNAIVKYGLLTFAVAAIALLLGVLAGKYAAEASTGFAGNLRDAMYENIQHFSFSNIDKYSTAGLVTRMTTDVTNIQNAYQMILRMAIRAPSSMVIAMIMAFTINAKLASIYLVAVIILGGCLVLIMSRASNYFSAAFKKYDDLNESVQENVSAIRVVKAYVREDYESEKFKKASGNVQDLLLRAEKVLSFNSPLMMATVYTCILLISWLGARMIVLSGATSFTTGELMSMLTYCTNILTSLMMLSMVFIMISMSAASAKRVAEVLEEESTLSNGENPVMKVKNGAVRFDHVCFRYKADGRDVLSDINLNIRSGETIGIIGGTGSAKSTLVNLIARLYDTTEGAVRVGGVDVRDYDLDALRHQVAMVLQKNVLFSGTIAENLRWGDPNATDEEVREAAHLACADEFVDGFPKGYDTWIEQGGSNVSGGQKQRLCIARALLRRPKILILDDSTSAVDTKTDAKIRAGLASYLPNTTKLIIAQRISSVQDADRIIVMEGGRIAQIGNHDELLKTSEIYRETFTSQNKMSAEGEGAVEADTEASATQAQTQEGGEAHE